MRLFVAVIVLLLFAPLANAQIGIPDLGRSWVEVDPGKFVIVPGGGGPSLADQGVVIHLWMRDGADQPIWSYPAEDIWLDDNGSGDIAMCQGGATADADTDVNGYTTISGPVFGGGWTQNGMSVYIAGTPTAQTPGQTDYTLDLQVNSPDNNGDLAINISDLALFAEDVAGYHFRSDYNFDDKTDLSDIALFSIWLVESSYCP